MSNPTIFTFWEPVGSMPPYVELCLETWKKNLSSHQIEVLNYSNLFEFVGEDSLDWALVKRLPLPIQKDAIQIAVLEEHGGVFLDTDTIAMREISHLLQQLQDFESLIFGDHVAFIAAIRKARCLSIWLNEIRVRIGDLRQNSFWGSLDRIIPRYEPIARLFRTAIRTRVKWHFLANSILPRVREQCLDHEFRQLDRDSHAFILETIYYAQLEDKTPRWKYENFWFSETLGNNTVLDTGQSIVALHNSWTPSWYKQLSRAEVLASRCLLSRTLKSVLEE